eukprot:scaffold8029_cov71-Phaeocystis_antarctica.AAC.3
MPPFATLAFSLATAAGAGSLTPRSPVPRHSIPHKQSTASKRVGGRTAEPAEWHHILVGP